MFWNRSQQKPWSVPPIMRPLGPLLWTVALLSSAPNHAQAQLFVPAGRVELHRYSYDGSVKQVITLTGQAAFDKAGVDFDRDGNLLVVQAGNSSTQKIERLSRDGAYLGTFATGNMDSARDLAVARNGDVFVVNQVNDGITIFDAAGNFLSRAFAGVGIREYIALDSDGNAYVSTTDGGRVLRLARGSNTFTTFATTTRNLPTGLAFDSIGNLYLSTASDILRYSPTGAFIDFFVTNSNTGPRDLVFGPDGSLYVNNVGSDDVRRFDTNGNLLGIFGPPANSVGFITVYPSSAVTPEPTSGGLLVLAGSSVLLAVRRRGRRQA